MKTKFIALLFGFLMTQNAYATGGIHCSAVDGRNAEIDISTGRLPVLGILDAVVKANGNTWSTQAGVGTQITVGQAFSDRTQTLVDFTDTNINEILVSLRLSSLDTPKDSAEAGVLSVDGMVYPVSCENE